VLTVCPCSEVGLIPTYLPSSHNTKTFMSRIYPSLGDLGVKRKDTEADQMERLKEWVGALSVGMGLHLLLHLHSLMDFAADKPLVSQYGPHPPPPPCETRPDYVAPASSTNINHFLEAHLVRYDQSSHPFHWRSQLLTVALPLIGERPQLSSRHLMMFVINCLVTLAGFSTNTLPLQRVSSQNP
jgi:hypothetical protein